MQLLHLLFENQSKNTPQKIAISSSFQKITYQELSDCSNQIAHRLLQSDIKKNTLVAVVMEKGWEQVAAVLGIMKAGAAYLPIDVNEHPERLSYLLRMGEVRRILTQKKYQSSLPSSPEIQILAVDDESVWENCTETPPAMQNEEDLAYVIFTSGTTGVPKGVMIDHRGAINTILDINHGFQIKPEDRVLAVSALHFDLSVYDIFGTLAAGGTIVMPTCDESKDPSRWTTLFLKEEVSIVNCVPALMHIFVEHLASQRLVGKFENHNLRLVLLSGDWIPVTLPDKIRTLFGNETEIISLGGATEASIWSILYPIQQVDKNWKSIPYGKAMNNQTFYILDEHLSAVIPNKIGELYIGGVGLAKGYWRDQQRTQSAFVSHPTLGRLYKTGDLGRYLPDGNIEFLGRVDYQVKINGHRIELSAIESCLLEHPAVRQTCVVAAGNNLNKYLTAYLVLQPEYMGDSSLLTRVQVAQWHKIHEDLGNNSAPLPDPAFNTQGWISSFTQKPMPDDMMQEWVSQTIARILSLNPKKVLEIGCGLGLLLFRLASRVSIYEGLDYSHSAINYLKQHLKTAEMKIGLHTGEAKDVREIYADQTFDVVILNSIIQYFPSIDYLIDVLNQSIELTEPGGYIFIGDVCSLAHSPIFHASVQWRQSTENISWTEWKAIVDYFVLQEEELLIDHLFFYTFQQKNPRISAVDIQIKHGQFDSEMNAFRYDVILYIDHQFPHSNLIPKRIDWLTEWLDPTALQLLLKKNNSPVLVIQDIPNRRIAGLDEILLQEYYFSCQSTSNVEEALTISQTQAIDPEQLYRIGESSGYQVSITWAYNNPLRNLDAIFIKKNPFHEPLPTSRIFPETITPKCSQYANRPLRAKSVDLIFVKLKKFLSTRLPAYMIPGVFMALDALPMNINGKIDRQALPPGRLNIHATEYIPATTELEKQLEKIWIKILKLDKIGMNDNFYELGGTSLQAVLIITEIQKVFPVHLNVGDIIFHGHSIHSLSLLLLQKMEQKETEKINFKKVARIQL